MTGPWALEQRMSMVNRSKVMLEMWVSEEMMVVKRLQCTAVSTVSLSPAFPSSWQKLDLLLVFSLTTVTSRREGAAGGGVG